ncbi:unnamed protein product [Rotaria sp. Silwood2]|nr:unnamed protein product [Rotaria sp. Silwood2]
MILLDLLSLSVNILCLIQKLPQIIRIYKTKNVASISISSVLLEETAYTLVLTYNLWRNYPLSAFFEYIFLFIQAASSLKLLPKKWMSTCTMFVIPIGASSKIIQLRTILSNKSAGQVSRTGWAIASYSNFARIITNLVQTKDMSMVINLLISFVLNISIVIACTIYSNDSVSKLTDRRKKKTT